MGILGILPRLASDVRDYILAYCRRGKKRPKDQNVAMLPARLLMAWEVIGMDGSTT